MTQSHKQEIINTLKVFEYAKVYGNISKACRYYGISRETYYELYRKYKARGEAVKLQNESRDILQGVSI